MTSIFTLDSTFVLCSILIYGSISVFIFILALILKIFTVKIAKKNDKNVY